MVKRFALNEEKLVSDLINLTPHSIRIYTPETPSTVTDIDQGLVTIIPPSGGVARMAEQDPNCGTTYGPDYLKYENPEFGPVHVPVDRVVFTTVYGLPGRRDGVYLIVPLLTAIAVQSEAPARDDLLVPYQQVRNTDGTVVGCRTLVCPC